MQLFYKLLSVTYLFSFASLYAQWPGLYGWNGLLPVDQFVSRVRPDAVDTVAALSMFWSRFPSVFLFTRELGVSAEALAESLLLAGLGLSALSVLRPHPSCVAFTLLWATYLSLTLVGQSFMSFQWDILLLEVGFLAAVSLLPPLSQGAGRGVAKLLFRFVLWKLMFMAGVVKLFAHCPTWINLTALEYHFATQPLPHALSWFAHQLHPLLLRAGVAATLLIEIPLTFLCIGHFRVVRMVGAVAQALLQLMIILTGNYNFFNFLTLALLVPVWASDRDATRISGSHVGKEKEQNAFFRTVAVIAFVVNVIAVLGALMFELKYLPPAARGTDMTIWSHLNFQLNLSPNVELYLPTFVRYAGVVAAGVVMLKGSVTIFKESMRKPMSSSRSTLLKLSIFLYRVCRAVFLVAILILYLWVSLDPMAQINSLTATSILPLSTTAKSIVSTLISNTRPYYVSSGYGLFRMMTGVGDSSSRLIGIGGVRPPVVARPEIVLEGFDEFDKTWNTIEFKYKPSDVMTRPRVAAPHQPRLDWQMWFAALGNYQREPWLINLVHKLLVGGEYAADVLDLLDRKRYPFSKPPQYIRATLYHYDFTRYNHSWMQLQGIDPKLSLVNMSIPSDLQPWWTRKASGEYFPGIENGNPSVEAFLDGSGLSIRSHKSLPAKYEHCMSSCTTTAQCLLCVSLRVRDFYGRAISGRAT